MLYNRTWPDWVRNKKWDGKPLFDVINETGCIVDQWVNGISKSSIIKLLYILSYYSRNQFLIVLNLLFKFQI